MVDVAIICFDYGHGGTDPGAIYRGRKEKDDNLEIGMLVAKSLRRYGVEVDETRTLDKTMTLDERCSFEKRKKYDLFVSFHRNAYEPEKARGVETYIYVRENSKSQSLAARIQGSLVELGFIDRGVKKDNFKVLRETLSPAVLIEIGFIDNTLDNEIFSKKKEKIVSAISCAILDELCIKYKEANVEKDTLYRVVTGSFKIKENADKRVKDLKKSGFDSYIREE